MGRTLPTSTMLIQEFEESWRPYARALRKEDREMLGELFAMVRFQSAAIAYASRPDPFQVFALAMLGGMMKRVMHLETIAERGSAAFAEDSGESFPSHPLGTSGMIDGHPSERDWQAWGPPRGTAGSSPSALETDFGEESDSSYWDQDSDTSAA